MKPTGVKRAQPWNGELCRGKRVYHSFQQAEKYARIMRRTVANGNSDFPVAPYKCSYGPHFHVGGQDPYYMKAQKRPRGEKE